MKGKVCGDFCEFTLDKGHFITGEKNRSKRILAAGEECRHGYKRQDGRAGKVENVSYEYKRGK